MPSINFAGTPQEELDIIAHPARMKVLIAGRRWGKTKTGILHALYCCMSKPRQHAFFLSQNYGLSNTEYKALVDNPSLAPLIRRKGCQPCPHIEWVNRSLLSFKSFDRPDLLRGFGIDFLQIDEAALFSGEAYSRILRPLVADRRGITLFTTTFRGRDWIYKLWERGQIPQNHKYIKSWLYPSWTGIAFQSPAGQEELRQIKLETPHAIWLQEYACEIGAKTNAAFPVGELQRCRVTRPVPQQPQPGSYYMMGLDLGRVQDPSAAVIVELPSLLVVHSENFPTNMPHGDQAMRAAQIAQRWRATVAVDCSVPPGKGHDSYEQIYRKTIPSLRAIFWEPKTKQNMINELSLAIQQVRIKIPKEERFDALYQQLEEYEFEHKYGHYYDFHAPKGRHDDLVAALAMANYGIHNHWAQPQFQGLPASALA